MSEPITRLFMLKWRLSNWYHLTVWRLKWKVKGWR